MTVLKSRSITRRGLLSGLGLLSLAACADDPAPPAPPKPPRPETRFVELERKFGARLGVHAVDTGTGRTVEHRADERFAFCSTFKAVAAGAVLHRHPLSHLDVLVHYTETDLMKNAIVTREHVATGMTIGQLFDAAIRYSDGTAGNLLVRDLGGPQRLTAFVRELGDEVTRMDRMEPAITEATPGDPRDTTSPRAWGADYRALVLGDVLPSDKRNVLAGLMRRNTTGENRIRAALPRGWTMANKTGTGDYGTLNDIAIVTPPGSAPLVLAVMSSMAERDAEYDETLVAEAAAHVFATLRGPR